MTRRERALELAARYRDTSSKRRPAAIHAEAIDAYEAELRADLPKIVEAISRYLDTCDYESDVEAALETALFGESE